MLRYPVDRVLSQWNWWNRCIRVYGDQCGTDHLLPNIAAAMKLKIKSGTQQCCKSNEGYHFLRNASLDDWLWGKEPRGEYMRSNHQTRVVCGMSAKDKSEFFWETAGPEVLEVVTKEHLECAKVCCSLPVPGSKF